MLDAVGGAGERQASSALTLLQKASQQIAKQPHYAVNVVVVIAYLVLGLCGVTTSNLGTWMNREDPSAAHPDTIGIAQSLRTDEFWVGVPLTLWRMTAPETLRVGEMSQVNTWVLHFAAAPAQVIAFWDHAPLVLYPLITPAMAVALVWWIPDLLVLLFVPSLFQLLGTPRRYGYAAALVVLFSPAQVWWSMQPAQIVGPTAAACVAMLSAYARFKKGEWLVPTTQAIAAGVLLSNVSTHYAPWVLILAGGVLAAVVAKVAFEPGNWPAKLWAVGVTGIVSLLLSVMAVLESVQGMIVMANTVYPSARRSAAAALPLGEVFGAPFLAVLAYLRPEHTNQSELSTSFNIVLLVLVILLPTQHVLWRKWRNNIDVLVLSGFGLMWLAWGSVDLGAWTAQLPLLNLVPAERAIQVTGFLGVLAFFLLLPRLGRIGRGLPAGLAILLGWLSGYAGFLLRYAELPQLPAWVIVLGALGVAGATFSSLRWPRRSWPLVLVVALSALTSFGATPIQIGLGDLRDSTPAQQLRAAGITARANSEVWATDTAAVDALLTANGVPSLSGVHRSGPDRDQWLRLDPSASQQNSWNRAAGYARFQWTNDTVAQITNTNDANIKVQIAPCSLAAAFPNLTHIVASVEISNQPCLAKTGSFTWAGKQLTIYRVKTA